MANYRSRTYTHGCNMAGARALWRATGMKDDDFGKPIIVIANSFTQFMPGHVHLKDMGQLVRAEATRSGPMPHRPPAPIRAPCGMSRNGRAEPLAGVGKEAGRA